MSYNQKFQLPHSAESYHSLPLVTEVTKDGGDTEPAGVRSSAPVSRKQGKSVRNKQNRRSFLREALTVVWMDNWNTELPLIQITEALAEDKGSSTDPGETTPAHHT